MGDERRAAQAVRGALRGVADYTAVAQTLAAADQVLGREHAALKHAYTEGCRDMVQHAEGRWAWCCGTPALQLELQRAKPVDLVL